MDNTENKFKQNGVWYIAVEQDGCRNCAFKTYDSRCCFPVELDIWCSIEERRDKRSVIFIESDADNFGDDE